MRSRIAFPIMTVSAHIQDETALPSREEGHDAMDPVTAATIASAIVGAAATVLGVWLSWRAERRRSRDAARRDYANHLPPGSRIVDLGRHGAVIDIGGQIAEREDHPHDVQ
jgi:hypothetical protein